MDTSDMKIKCNRVCAPDLPLLTQADGGSLPDLRTRERSILRKGEATAVPLNLRLEIPPNHFGLLLLRSSLALKGLLLSGGLIDNSFRYAVLPLSVAPPLTS